MLRSPLAPQIVHEVMEAFIDRLASSAKEAFTKDLEAQFAESGKSLKPIPISKIIKYIPGITGVVEFEGKKCDLNPAGAHTFITCCAVDQDLVLAKTEGKADPAKYLWDRRCYLTWTKDHITDYITALELAEAKSDGDIKAILMNDFVNKIQRAQVHLVIWSVFNTVEVWKDALFERLTKDEIGKILALTGQPAP